MASAFSKSPFDPNPDDLPDVDEQPIFAPSPSDQDDHQDSRSTDNEALYAILNVPREATEEQIQKSYKRLAALLHPDRHPDLAMKSAADSRFQQLSRAYEILSNPQQRAIYDALGEEGLKSTWEVGNKYKSSDELRKEFERMGRVELEKNVESLVRSKGDLTIVTDARVLLLPDEERVALGGPPQMSLSQKLSSVKINQMVLKHSFTTPISPSTSVVLTSQLLARQGVGAGNVLGKILYNPSSKLSLELGTTLLRPRAFSIKATYTPEADSFATLSLPIKNLSAPPQFTLTLGRRITTYITSTFTLRSGAWSLGPYWGHSSLEPISSSTISFGLNHVHGWGLETTSGVLAQQLTASYTWFVLGGVKVQVGGVVTSQGAVSTFVSGDRRLTETLRGGLTLDLAVSGIMTVKLRANRLGQRFTIPVVVSSSWNPTLAASFTVLPALVIIAANHWFVDPRRKRKVSSKITELRKEHSEFILQKRKEADDAVVLLREHVRRKVEAETACDGLVILEATYGVLESITTPTPDPLDQRWFDVTIAIQALVTSSQLVIPGGRSKASLLGFYDCAIGEKKQLKVKYTFKGRMHELVVSDGEAVAAPLRAHLVE